MCSSSRSCRASSALAGFVHEADIRRAQQDAGDADALPLAAGQAGVHLPHVRVVSVREGVDERRDARALGRAADFLHRRVRLGDADVFRDGRVEQVGVLFQKGDAPVQFRKRDALDRDPVYKDLPRRRRIEAQQQAQDGGLARARFAGDANADRPDGW